MPKIEIISTVNSAQYKRGIEQMKQQNQRFGNSTSKIKGLVKKAFAVAAVIGFVRALAKGVGTLIQFGSRLSDVAAQADVSVETFQRLQRAVRDAGGQDQNLVNALARVKSAQGDVLRGDKILIEAFEQLGISIKEIAQLDTEGLFVRIAQGLTKAGNGAKEFNATADIIGQRNVPKLIEALNAIGTDTESLGKDLKVLANENAQALDLIADKWEQFKNNVKTGLAGVVAAGFKGLFGRAEVDARIAAQKQQAELARQARVQQQADLEAQQAAERRKKTEEEITKEKERRAKIREQQEAIRQSVKLEIDTDRFRRIGGAVGASAQAINQQRRALEIQRRQEELLTKIENNTKKSADEGGGLAP